jgi:hypothetical protein
MNGTYDNGPRHENGASAPAVYEVPPVTHVSRSMGCEVANTDVGSVLSVYIMALTPAIKIASRPTQPAAY